MKKAVACCAIVLASMTSLYCSSESPSSGDGSGPATATEPSVATSVGDCTELEPDNPYSPGSGHYAGFEWAENNSVSSCGGNSTSFVEGCEEYIRQADAYDACVSKR